MMYDNIDITLGVFMDVIGILQTMDFAENKTKDKILSTMERAVGRVSNLQPDLCKKMTSAMFGIMLSLIKSITDFHCCQGQHGGGYFPVGCAVTREEYERMAKTVNDCVSQLFENPVVRDRVVICKAFIGKIFPVRQ